MDVEVTYGGDKIPDSPFPVDVAPPLDLDKVKVKNLGESTYWNDLEQRFWSYLPKYHMNLSS